MKKYTSILLIMFTLSTLSFAQVNEKVVTTLLKEVTVSLNGASLKRTTSVNLSVGVNTLKVIGLSATMDESSLQFGLDNSDTKILSVSTYKDFISNSKKSKTISLLNDSLENLKLKKEILLLDIEANKIEKQLLTDNISRIGKDGVSVTELQSTVPYYRSQLKQIHEKQISQITTLNSLDNIINKINTQLNALNSKVNTETYTVTLTVESKLDVKSNLVLMYVSKSAAWLPQYNIRTKGAGSPIVFDYKATVVNKTGEDWENVVLKITTADPSKLVAKPILEVWGLNYSSQYNNGSNVFKEGLLNNRQMMQNSAISDNIKGKANEFTEIEVNEVSTEFSIKDKTTILSDGTPQTIDVTNYEFTAQYQYYCVPKIDKDVFLMGKITNWESMNLIDGDASVYIDNIYIGKSQIDTKTANDTLELFLGIDKKVIVNRVKKKDESEKKMIGLNKKESFIYHTSIRNTNNVAINIEVVDQVPISQESDIEVTVNDISKASKDDLSGKLTWNLTIQPAETQKLVLDFSVKFPRNRSLNLFRSRKVTCPTFW